MLTDQFKVAEISSKAPLLLVFIDAEEEFEWYTFSRTATGVRNMGQQGEAQRILNRYGIKPTYLVDYPVASQPDGYLPLREFHRDGLCSIGTQLHPWVNPPFLEKLSAHNSFPGNLDPGLENQKIWALTNEIRNHFGEMPTVYRAGRYGLGPKTIESLKGAGYLVDASVVPFTDFRDIGGPNFAHLHPTPFWLDRESEILEIPITVSFAGLLAPGGRYLERFVMSRQARALHITGAFARSRLFERIRLTPEGVSIEEAKRLTRFLVSQGNTVFSMTYHSSSLLPGSTPYVATDKDYRSFLDWLEEYCDFFFGEIQGASSTPQEVYAKAREASLSKFGEAVAATNKLEVGHAPLVSVIIPAYNAASFVVRALQSVIGQSVSDLEIIVVDDASADDTCEVVRSVHDERIRLIECKSRAGAAGARNVGIAQARGKYVAFLDADDEWLPEKLEKQLLVMKANPGCVLVGCRAHIIDEDGVDHGDIYHGSPWTTGAEAWRLMLAHPFISTPSVFTTRAALNVVGPFNPALPVAEDQDMWIRLALHGNVGYVPQHLVTVYSTPNSLTKAQIAHQASYTLPMVESHIAAHRLRLSNHEVPKILGERYARIGRTAYGMGDFKFGLHMIGRAIRLGYRPLNLLFYVLRASPAARRFKEVIRTFLGRMRT